ncbi:MAG: hypothetical protein H7Z17_18075 [Fuerstia sp.]|nr:hypothetical protein [Fuerstiella sp.]
MGTSESETFNPYAAPLVGTETADPFQQDDTRIRQQFIGCESNVRSIGGLMFLGGLILAFVFGFLSVNYFSGGAYAADPALAAFFGMLALVGVVQLIVGIRVGSFRPRPRIGAIIFCALWLMFIPVGTIIGGACLWYLLRPAARYVFTPEYRDVIKRTPHVHFQTSAVSWGILITVLIAFLTLVAIQFLRSYGAR